MGTATTRVPAGCWNTALRLRRDWREAGLVLCISIGPDQLLEASSPLSQACRTRSVERVGRGVDLHNREQGSVTKRIGRFEFDGTFESGGFPRRIDILMDHANGDARVYEFP